MSDFTDLVKRLNNMETSEDKSFENEASPNQHSDPNVQAMASILESVNKVDEAPKQLKGKDKLKTVKPGEADGTTKNPSKGKLVGEERVSEDLLGQLKKEFTDLLVAKEEQETTEDVQDDRKYQSLEELRDKLVDIEKHIKRLGIMDSATEIQGKPVSGTADIHDQLTTMYKNIEGLQGAVARALKVVPGQQNPDVQKFNKKYGTTEAVGEFAEPIYQLCDELECPDNHPVFDELVRYMSGDQIKDFVADFRRHHDMNKDQY